MAERIPNLSAISLFSALVLQIGSQFNPQSAIGNRQSAIRNPQLFCYTLIRSLRSRPGDRPRLGDFESRQRFEITRNVGGKSEHHRTAGWLTARRGDPTE